MTPQEYDSMTEEERTAHDAAARKREAEEQAGTPFARTEPYKAIFARAPVSRIAHTPNDITVGFSSIALPYKWRQTLVDVDVSVKVPKGTRSKDLVVEIKKKSLKVGLKGQPLIIE
ncbi:hypothetical protein BGZ72_000173, partial [Mortierella alpina]